MKITSLKLETSHFTANEEAPVRCETALILKDKGDSDGAQKVMRPLWERIGERPGHEGARSCPSLLKSCSVREF